MLLVDHYQTQPVELDFFFDQRVGSDYQLRFAAVDLAAIGALALRVERAGQQYDARLARRVRQQLACRQIMLRGQNFSGGHQRRLIAVFDGHQHRFKSHDCFSRAHVAL